MLIQQLMGKFKAIAGFFAGLFSEMRRRRKREKNFRLLNRRRSQQFFIPHSKKVRSIRFAGRM